MSSFDPPTGPPLSEEPLSLGRRRPHRRVAFVALVTVGLLGAGVVGAGQLGSDDRPDVAAASVRGATAPDTTVPNDPDTTVPNDPDTTVPNDPDASVPDDTVLDDAVLDDTVEDDRSADVSGRIELDVGDGDPIVIDLDEFDAGVVGRLGECLGLPSFDLRVGGGPLRPGDMPEDLDTWLEDWFSDSDGPDRWPAEHDLDTFLDDALSEWDVDIGDLGSVFGELFAEFGPTTGGRVTVSGSNGVSVIDLGEDGSVTITRDDGETTIETTGDATVADLDEPIGDLGTVFGDRFDTDGELNVGDELQQWIEEMLEGLPTDELPEFRPVDPTELQRCIDDALGR